MAVETAAWVTQLVDTNPVVGDPVGEGDDHLRMVKTVLKNSFPSTSTTAIVPNVSGQTGKYLTNDGTDTSWGTVSAARNMIINGAMQIAQRSVSVQKQYNTSNGYYTCDRVRTSQGNLDNAVWTMTQDSHLLTGPAGFPNSWKITVDTAETALAVDENLQFQYNIEANSCQNLAYGTAGAKTTTTSFWVKSDVTGTYSLYLYSYDANRSIGGTYTISSADTWEYKTVTLVGDTAGTGINNDSGVGVTLYFPLSAGTDRTATDNTSWGAHATGKTAYGQTANLLASATDYWQITGLQFEIGSVATPFEHKTYGQELEDCERYYQTYASGFFGFVVTTSIIDAGFSFRKRMRASPSVTLLDDSPAFSEINVATRTGSSSSITTSANYPDGTGMVRIDGFGGAATANRVAIGYNGSTDMLGFDAEIT